MSEIADRWITAFFAAIMSDRDVGDSLRGAAIASDLGRWTELLTTVVASSLVAIGLVPAAKGFPGRALPVSRQEYLGLDFMGFEAGDVRWRMPVVVGELENSRNDDLVEYSLWKVLAVRCSLRLVFCYRGDGHAVPSLVLGLAKRVVGALSIAERSNLVGDTLVIVGSKSESTTFPYGFFEVWRLNANIGLFERRGR